MVFLEMRKLNPPVIDGRALYALRAGPSSTTRKFQAWASGEEVGSGKLPNFQKEKEATALNSPSIL